MTTTKKRPSRVKPGEYIPLTGDLDYEAVKGHVTPEVFAETLRFECGPEVADGLVLHHAYGASLQTAQARDEGWSFEFRVYSTGGRGRYPVTLGYRPGDTCWRAGTPVVSTRAPEGPSDAT